jgi:putative permease
MNNVTETSHANQEVSFQHIAFLTAVVLMTLGVVLLMWQFSGILALLLVSLAVAAMTRAPADWLTRHRVPRSIALLLVYVSGVLIVLGIAWFVLPHLVAELQTLAQDLSTGYLDFQARWMAGTRIQQGLMHRLPSPSQLNEVLFGSMAGLTQLALGATLNVFDVVAQSLLVIVISLYWSADRQRFERLMLSLLSPTQRARARNAWREIERGLGAYLRSEIAQCLLAGALLSAGFWALGLRYPFTCAVFAALAWLLPLVGGVVAIIPVLLIGVLTNSTLAVIATLYTFAVFALLEFGVERKLYPRERYGSVLVLLITLVMVEALGVIGLLIAPPMAAAIQIALTEWLRPAPIVTEAASQDVSMPALKTRLAEAQTQLTQLEQPSPRTQNLMTRLNELIEKAEYADHINTNCS